MTRPTKVATLICGTVAWLLLFVYAIRVYIFAFGEPITNLDAEEFWLASHPYGNISSISLFDDSAKTRSNHNFLGRLEKYGHSKNSTGHDPRVLPVFWLHSITTHLQSSNAADKNKSANFSLPFSWDSLLGISSNSEFCWLSKTLPDCSFLLPKGADKNFLRHLPCRINDPKSKSFRHRVFGPVDAPFSESKRKYIGASYLLHTLEDPSRVIILSASSREGNATIVASSFTVTKEGDTKEQLSSIRHDHFENNVSESSTVEEQLEEAQAALKAVNNDKNENLEDDESYETTAHLIDLIPDEFDSTSSVLSPPSHFSIAETVRRQDPNSTYKHFHEAQLSETHVGFHYDWRFFKTSRLSIYERKFILHRLAKAWLRFSRTAGLKTWLAHGTLLGWYWNGMNLPWDNDIDVQMTFSSLKRLASAYNQSLVMDLVDDPNVAGVHSYFIDVSPEYNRREHGSGNNVIDARFIDTETGMYVDITALAINEDLLLAKNRGLDTKIRKLHEVFVPNYQEIVKSAELSTENIMHDFHSDLEDQERKSWESRSLYSCKDLHFYELRELTPLTKTMFEGETAFVPREYSSLLRREYPKGLTSKVYGDWIFRPYFGLWTPLSKCRNDWYGDQCDDKDTILEEKYTRSYRLKSREQQGFVEPQPRLDPYFIRKHRILKNL